MDFDTLGTVATTAAWLWANYGKDVTEATAQRVQSQVAKTASKLSLAAWKKFNWSKASESYRQEVYRQYGNTNVLGKPEPIGLDDIFTDVYILDKLSAFRRFEITSLRADPQQLMQNEVRVNGLKLVQRADSTRLFILGKPGAGKTTFLKYIAVQAVKGDIDKIPIFISLKAWFDSELGLGAFINRQFEICSFPEPQEFIRRVLEKGDAIVLFDGLDEVSQEDRGRERSIAAIRDFCLTYQNTQVLMTCRIAATDYTFQEFRYVELADFTEKQVRVYVEKWFSDSPAKRKKFFAEYEKDENRGLRDLARVPLLLGLLCISFDATMTFPQRRVEIYEEALEALLKKWDSSRSITRDEIYKGLSLGRKRQMLSRIAARTFQENNYFISKDLLSKYVVDYIKQLPDSGHAVDIDGHAVIEAMVAQHGIFNERASRIYSFSHLTFQEYFAAKYTVEDTSGQSLKGLLHVVNISDSRWREVILLVASLLDEADSFFELFMTSIASLIRDEPVRDLLGWTADKGGQNANPVMRFIYLYLELRSKYSEDRLIPIKVAISSIADRLLRDTHGKQALQQAMELPELSIYEANRRSIASFCTRVLDRTLFLERVLGAEFAARWCLYSQLGLAERFTEAKASLKLEQLFRLALAQSDSKLRPGSELRRLLPNFRGLNELPIHSIAQQLRKFMNDKPHNIGHMRSLSEQHVRDLAHYVGACALLLDCLSLAVVSDRTTVVANLGLPEDIWQTYSSRLGVVQFKT